MISPQDFDAIIVDAPCSGTGTLRRRPEIALRLTPEDPGRLAELQTKILRTAAQLLRPGGRLIYAVCSVLQVEGADVVEATKDVLEPSPFPNQVVDKLAGGDSELRLLPGRHQTDGYYLASLKRRGPVSTVDPSNSAGSREV